MKTYVADRADIYELANLVFHKTLIENWEEDDLEKRHITYRYMVKSGYAKNKTRQTDCYFNFLEVDYFPIREHAKKSFIPLTPMQLVYNYTFAYILTVCVVVKPS